MAALLTAQHHFTELVEQVDVVARAGAALGVVLHGEHRLVAPGQALVGAVVDVKVRD